MNIKFLKIKWISRKILIITILLISSQFFCNSQNLYDLEQSQKYAEYLYSSQQHKLAAEEYERLIYFDESNIDFKYKLIRSYRLSGDNKSGINRIYSLYGNSFSTMPQSLATEFVKMQILSDSVSVAGNFLSQVNTITSEKKASIQCCNLLLKGQYKEAQLSLNMAKAFNYSIPEKLVILTENGEKIKFKSPIIAGVFSAIIPGTGKFYTKNWTDGIFSMLFIAGNTWQAYRGFSEHGINSGYGWVFTGLSTSFYIGNIFGSVKAANRYNRSKKDEINNQVFEFVRTDNF